ncbi:MAG: response regulator [Desulfamplus sp.]|nr:response regulator [Desulfamplus sp.]
MFFKKIDKTVTESDTNQEIEKLRSAIEKTKLDTSIAFSLKRELERLERMDTGLPEYSMGVNYIEYIVSLPWNRFTKDNLNFKRAEKILEEQHYGLKHVKERILEHLAVMTLHSQRKFQILVVDDEEISRTNLEHVLKKDGHQVATAIHGLDALEKMQNQEFEILITDLKMEKMDGMQLIESVKEFSPNTDIIMITGFATVTSAVNALQKGAAHYLPKPLNLEELRSVIRDITESRKHFQMTRSPVLCFVGPPGTGKTSIGRSIADALKRKFVRFSLAGLRDEAELRGHRRTYVGAMAGRIMNEIKRLNVKNPVFMLDEIDKIGQDFRGDPSSVLLEILDPEQNTRFNDHYLEIPFDLSSIMFIATANSVQNMSGPLLDRMELINFPGYTEKEKIKIAKNYLISRQIKENALSAMNLNFSDSIIAKIIQDHTLEAGLRSLDREISTVCRKIARLSVENSRKTIEIDQKLVDNLLGLKKYRHETARLQSRVGIATGLVWTEFGGEIIFVEATMMKGSQQLILTGSLGNVLRESAQTSLSFIRSNAELFSIDPDFFREKDIHIHIPSGAIPKDGPSAGITITLALISLLTKRATRKDIALTGEITLSGLILPISGIRDKILAAQRAGIKKVVFPKQNEAEIDIMEAGVIEGVEIIFADEMTLSLINLVTMPPFIIQD